MGVMRGHAMTRPGTGTSLTTGEAAARRQALGEAARVARAAVMGDETDAVCLNIADDIRALMDRAPDVDPRDAEIVRLHDLQDGLVLRVEADRARLAELERELADVARWHEAAVHKLATQPDAFQRGAEARPQSSRKNHYDGPESDRQNGR